MNLTITVFSNNSSLLSEVEPQARKHFRVLECAAYGTASSVMLDLKVGERAVYLTSFVKALRSLGTCRVESRSYSPFMEKSIAYPTYESGS